MKWLVAGLITTYQRFVSPWKGYCCAYRRLYGGGSCSDAVRKLVLANGLLASIGDIRSRFAACKAAAADLRNASPAQQQVALDCDFGFSSCGLFDNMFGGTGCFGAGTESSSPATRPAAIVSVGITTQLVLLAAGYWIHGRKVDVIQIRLIDAANETKNVGLAALLDGKLPDYQVILDSAGDNLTTNTQRNASAKDWLILKPREPVTDIDRLTIVNKLIVNEQVLEIFEQPTDQGAGELFEYEIRRNWDLF